MKRMYNKIPLGSVTACISGLQKIRVVNGKDGMTECVFNGLVKDLSWYEYARIEYSELHEVTIDGDVIVFRIDNEYEEF